MRWHPTAPWFGPKRLGWGWRPLTWQGWLITLILAILLVGIRIAVGTSPVAFALMVCVLILFGGCRVRHRGATGAHRDFVTGSSGDVEQ